MGSGIFGGSLSTNQVAYGSGINSIQGSNNLWFDGANLAIGTNIPIQALTVAGFTFHL